MELKFYGITDEGNKRPKNEDKLWPPEGTPQHPYVNHPRGQLFVVADGMGGYGAGNIASQITIDTMSAIYYADATPGETPHDWLEAAIEESHQKITAESKTSEAKARMGTTVVAAVIKDDKLWFAWVGDSRVYLLRNNQLEQLSEDHSVLWKQYKEGLIKWDALHYHPQRSKLNNSLTARRAQVKADFRRPRPLQNGDQILLCSDGLSSEVHDDQLEQILRGSDLLPAAQALVTAAKSPKMWLKDGQPTPSQGGEDNITAIIVHTPGVIPDPAVLPAPTQTAAATASDSNLKWLGAAAAAALLLLLLLTGMYLLLGSQPTTAQNTAQADQSTPGDANIDLGAMQVTPITPTMSPQSSSDQAAVSIEPTATLAPGETPQPTSTRANITGPTPLPPTNTPAPFVPTATPTETLSIDSDQWPTPELMHPKTLEDDPTTYFTNDPQNFAWKWSGDKLPPGYGFEIRIGLEDASPEGAYDAREMTKNMEKDGDEYSFSFKLESAASVKQSSNQYFWQVGLVKLDPFKWLGIASEPRRINIAFPGREGGGGGGDNDSDSGNGGGGMTN